MKKKQYIKPQIKIWIIEHNKALLTFFDYPLLYTI